MISSFASEIKLRNESSHHFLCGFYVFIWPFSRLTSIWQKSYELYWLSLIDFAIRLYSYSSALIHRSQIYNLSALIASQCIRAEVDFNAAIFDAMLAVQLKHIKPSRIRIWKSLHPFLTNNAKNPLPAFEIDAAIFKVYLSFDLSASAIVTWAFLIFKHPVYYRKSPLTFQHEYSVLDYKDYQTVTKVNYTCIMQKLKDKLKPRIFSSFEWKQVHETLVKSCIFKFTVGSNILTISIYVSNWNFMLVSQ